MEEAEHCDRIAIIDVGNIIALDTPEELKSMVGGDIIKLVTVDDEQAEVELKRKYPDIEMIPDPDCFCFEVEKGEEFIPGFIRDFGVEILAINVHRPTLDDVFLKLTGKEIRDEGADALADLRAGLKMGSRMGRR
jgi:ABC-2 type transport system ATP-binding protein